MAKFGWCIVWSITPHVGCRREFKWGAKTIKCDCPCHIENDKALEELI